MAVETVQIGAATEPVASEPACRIGWTFCCPYRSCAAAGSCMAPAPAEDERDRQKDS